MNQDVKRMFEDAYRVELRRMEMGYPPCRICGCNEDPPCQDEFEEDCSWVEPDLCSVCQDNERRNSHE
jgi:hypothetical protein